ncbi:MAG: NAD(P)-dependent glycerol-3-phosphate dehydrogenase [Micavibrio sp.]|nr:NAD(P)-dependent glycerol-3-phosphate dehydrogenase [Micavibrio sp.]
MTKTIGVIGAGAWGTALAQVFASDGRDTLIWAREEEAVDAINSAHENTMYLKGVPLDERLKATKDIEDIAKRNIVLIVSPAQHLRAAIESISHNVSRETILVICAKGIEISSGKLMSQVVQEILPEAKLAVLTGPTFASEVSRGLPCAVTIGSDDSSIADSLLEELSTPTFRPYSSDDMIGVQLGGAIKNVIAIGCGMVHGKGLGESTRCALMTRGLAEMARLGTALGGQNETLLGMCGVGDLVLTASSMQSRNFSLGAALGEGKTLAEILGTRSAVTEGVHTARVISEVANKNNVEMPICQAINQVLQGHITIDDAIDRLQERPLKAEI